MQVENQLLFNGTSERIGRFAAPPAPAFDGPIDLVFFSILPDRDARTRIVHHAERLRRDHGLTGQVTPAERLHVALQCVPVPRGAVEWFAVIAGFVALDIGIPSFELSLDGALSLQRRNGRRAVVLRGGAGEVMGLFQILGEGIRRLGFGEFAPRSFMPHVTMLCDRRDVAPHPVEPISWRVREFVLIHSAPGQGRHDILRRWPLKG